MKRSFLKSLIWICAIVAVLFVSSVAYSGPILKRYPGICTDVSGLLTAKEEGFIPCSWYQNGSAPGTPTYVANTLATPMYMEIKDWNSNLQLDIVRLSTIVAGLANTYQGAVVISTGFGYNGVEWLPNFATTGVPHFDLRRINGNAVSAGGGNMDAGTLTMTIAADDVVSVGIDTIASWQLNTGTINANTQRVTVATNDTVATDLTIISGWELNTGAISASTQRVTMATDDTVATDLTTIAGDTTTIAGWTVGTGAMDATTQRVTMATDDTVATDLAVLAAWEDGNNRASVNPGKDYTLDLMNATTGWTVGNDATESIAISANHVEGTNSLTFNKVDGSNFTEGFIQKTISAVNLVTFENHATVEFAIYASTVADVAYAFVRMGTDSSNYSEWRVDDDELTAGTWNAVSIFAGDVEYAVTGTGAISSAITWVAVGFSFDAENDTLAGIAVDDLKVHESSHTTTRLTSEVTSSVNTANINMQKIGNQTVNMQGGNIGNGTQRIAIATDDVNMAAINTDTTTIAGDTTSIQTSIELRNAKLDDDAVAQCVAITDTDADYAIITAGDWVCMNAVGNTAFVRCGATPAVDHTVGNFSFMVAEGATKCRRLTGPNCAVIGVTTAGFLCFEHLNSAL